MTDYLHERAKGFDPQSSILRAYLAGIKMIKTQPQPETRAADEDLRDMVLDALPYAYSAVSAEYDLLDELASTLNDVKRKRGGALPWLDELVTGVPSVPQEMIHDPGPNLDPFHVLVLRFGLTKYFADCKEPYYTPCGASLLLVCIVYLHFHHPEYGIDIHRATVAVVNKGADVNQALTGHSTVWAFVLCALCIAGPKQSQDGEISELDSEPRETCILPETFSTITWLLERGADPNVESGDGYPIWLDIADPRGRSTRSLCDHDLRFQLTKAFVNAGASVKSPAALQVWDSQLSLALQPNPKALTDRQITDFLVFAIGAGADLNPARLLDLKYSIPPKLFLRVDEAWSCRHEGTRLAELVKTSRQKPAKLWSLFLNWMVWFTFSCLSSYITLLSRLHETILRIHHEVAGGIWRLERSFENRMITYYNGSQLAELLKTSRQKLATNLWSLRQLFLSGIVWLTFACLFSYAYLVLRLYEAIVRTCHEMVRAERLVEERVILYLFHKAVRLISDVYGRRS